MGASSEDIRIMREQVALDDTAATIRGYGAEQTACYAGLRFINSTPGDRRPCALQAYFTDHLDDHLAALRARVPRPDRVFVEAAPHSVAEVAAARPIIEDEVRAWAHGRIPGFAIGDAIGRVGVRLYALDTDNEEQARQFAADLRRRHGDIVEASVASVPRLGA